MAAMVIAGWIQVGLGQNQSLEEGEQFSISVGDKLSFDFKDGTCANASIFAFAFENVTMCFPFVVCFHYTILSAKVNPLHEKNLGKF